MVSTDVDRTIKLTDLTSNTKLSHVCIFIETPFSYDCFEHCRMRPYERSKQLKSCLFNKTTIDLNRIQIVILLTQVKLKPNKLFTTIATKQCNGRSNDLLYHLRKLHM